MKLAKKLVESLELRYKYEQSDAVARLAIYLKNPVGIGEHPQHTEEMDKLVQQYTDAKDKLQSLKEMLEEVNNLL